MRLKEIFDQLSYGEFSQLSLGGADAGVIDESNWPQVLAHVNMGLTALYKRFSLKEGRLVLRLIPDRTLYTLTSEYSVLSTRRPSEAKYIEDTPDVRFKDDILKIERVLTDSRHELGLNDWADDYSVHTPSATKLRIPVELVSEEVELPDCLKTEKLTVVYRANHTKLTVPIGYFDPARVEIELPDTHLEPLLYFVASRVHTPIGMQNEFHAGNSYYAKYEAACQGLENKSLQIDQVSQYDRIRSKGWV